MIDVAIAERLRELSHQTRVSQAQYIREAVSDLLAKHLDRTYPRIADYSEVDGQLTSLVFRTEESDFAQLVELANRTRVRQSEYIREALVDLLAKHGAR